MGRNFFVLFVALWMVSIGIVSGQIQPRRVMSFNVRNAAGMDGKRDYDRTADVIRRANPFVVAIQELDSVTRRSKGDNVLQELALRTGMYPTYAKAINYDSGGYGIGILSKEKPVSVSRIPLPGSEEPRVMLLADFSDFLLCATHFSLTEKDVMASIEIIRQTIDIQRRPVLLAGDLNISPSSQAYKELTKIFTPLTDIKKATYPAGTPKACIDYILSYNNGVPVAVHTKVVMDEPTASDHRPVYVDVVLGAPKEQLVRMQPYLQCPVGGGMTVSWITHRPTYSWVEYGVDTTALTSARTLVDGQAMAGNTHHKIRLEGLRPGERYYYRICSREMLLYAAYRKEFGQTYTSSFYSFVVPAEEESDFTALIFNDLHKQKATVDALMKQVGDRSYDLVLFNGDCIDDPRDEQDVLGFMAHLHQSVKASQVPVMYIRGNHEIRNAHSIALRDLLEYVNDKTYHAFSIGGTRLVVLDCGEDKPDDTWVYYGLNDFSALRNDQYAFLKDELSSRAFKKSKQKVLIHHIPIYGADIPYNPSGDLWKPLLSKAPFNISLNAHEHRFDFFEAGKYGNNFPVVVGGGYRLKDATVMILHKTKGVLGLTVLNTKGDKLLELSEL